MVFFHAGLLTWGSAHVTPRIQRPFQAQSARQLVAVKAISSPRPASGSWLSVSCLMLTLSETVNYVPCGQISVESQGSSAFRLVVWSEGQKSNEQWGNGHGNKLSQPQAVYRDCTVCWLMHAAKHRMHRAGAGSALQLAVV